MPEKYWPETIVLWGAGATKYLGLHGTKQLIELILKITKDDFSFLYGKDEKLINAFKKLINYDLINDKRLSKIYDIKALKIIIKTNAKLDMHELFTMMDQLIENNMGYNAFLNGNNHFLRVERIQAAKRCLILIIEELERISVQNKPGYFDRENISPYYEFSKVLTELMVEEGKEFERRGYKRDSRRFYLYSYAIISFNWDPVLLWNLCNTNREINKKNIKLKDGLNLKLYEDFGIQTAFIGSNYSESEIKYTVDESQCKGINDYNYPSRIIRMGKMLFPHGMFGSRICPECGKYIINLSNSCNKMSTNIFGPSLLKDLQIGWQYRTSKEKTYERGSIECPYCGQITYPYDMPIIMQTLANSKKVSCLREIKTEMGLIIKHAKHIVFAGYSLPIDDIMVKTFFMSSISGNDKKTLKCSLINYDSDYCGGKSWLTGQNISEYLNVNKDSSKVECIKNICDIFNIDNVRISLKGIPDIFMENGKCSREKVIDLLYPRKFFREGFPIIRD
ncbi:hypothetical protein KM799_08750 [Clostridium tyrobutyricum]|uniref:hypothetical protein n=1 Tax=Clostridium tyrobutyricum TaxID=1519 RepID=UPI00057C8B0A|nr:hypothetical protein [Clostridium tyrobutyricum]MBR9647562.1 hypothetical protein [Clostridium tyrobutyricum]MBV4446690.1 hypothetical protein [Clostridium tyrobutyricum]QCH27919.1 hypothetical protein EZN00_01517 [Clostridium tyrobutyricum]